MGIKQFITKVFRRDLQREYVSDVDKFLTDFDKTHPQRSQSQKKEMSKYKRIARLRDNPNVKEDKVKIWDEF